MCIRDRLGEGKPLRRIIASGEIPNMIFYGPSGVGKTTLASIIARQTHRKLCKLNGTTASTADIREVVASLDRLDAVNGVLLYLDEIQYFNKKMCIRDSLHADGRSPASNSRAK